MKKPIALLSSVMKWVPGLIELFRKVSCSKATSVVAERLLTKALVPEWLFADWNRLFLCWFILALGATPSKVRNSSLRGWIRLTSSLIALRTVAQISSNLSWSYRKADGMKGSTALR